MGKIRIKTVGLEDEEKKQKEQAKKRAEAKKAQGLKEAEEKGETVAVKVEEKTEIKALKQEVHKVKVSDKKGQNHSQKYITVAAAVDKNKKYSISEALALLPKLKRAKFDETVELHINTVTTGVSGSVVLPHGTGKTVRIEILNKSEDAKHVDEVVKKIEAGQIDFDVLIATPDSMAKLGRVARYLGPRGLMPNPKNGTVTPKPQEIAKKYAGGQLNFKTEAKFPIMHVAVGKASFGEKELKENITAMIEAIQQKNIKTITLKSTMSPGISVDIATI